MIPTYYKQNRNKYNNRKVTVDGIKFDSKHEAEIYSQLKMLERCNKITNLRLQVPFILLEKYKINNRTVREIKYIADFTFINSDGQLEVWDAKGVRTDCYKLKKKIFEFRYGIEIKEV